LLGWMHRKFRPIESLKDISIGNPCTCLAGHPSLDDQRYHRQFTSGAKSSSKAQRDDHLRKSFAILEGNNFDEDSSVAISELFHGFLTIGTLGSDPVITEPSTPTFGISVENITEKEAEVTENELKLINDELEKVLGTEGKEDSFNDSSGRNSHVSTGRSSHGSTITLSGKPLEDTETNGNGTRICPLQGYLFGSAIELPETTAAKKKHRTSLGELFQMTKIEEGNLVSECEREEKLTEKETDKSVIYSIKKKLKKRMVHASSRTSTTATGVDIDSASTMTKLHKILQMFQRKVHPESSMAERKSNKPHKNDINNKITEEGCYSNEDQVLPYEDIMIFPQRTLSKESQRSFKSHSDPPQVTPSGIDSNGNREYWIKTDAEYLVLEL
ncbi:Protein LAZY like, partial [Actinidia chinensis var. chinensis]